MLGRALPIAMIALTALGAAPARAQDVPGAERTPVERYDWPFRARPLEASSFVRADVAMATSHEGREGPHEYAMGQLVTIGVAPTDWLVPYVRGGWAFQHDRRGSEGSIFGNLEVGASALTRISQEVRFGGHFAVFLPTGSGQGSSAPAHETLAQQEGARARHGTDSALFLTSHAGLSASVAIAYAHAGLVAQLELGLEGVWRVDGPETGGLAPTGAVHLAYFVLPELSLAVELTHHQWAAGRVARGSPDAVTSILVGARAHARLGSVVLRPGASYSHALGGTLEDIHHHVLQIDLVVDL